MSTQPTLIEVAFSIPDTGTFTYSCPIDKEAKPGCRVIAPFGRRTLTGYVTGFAEKRPAGGFAIKSIERSLDTEPLFDDEILELARWT